MLEIISNAPPLFSLLFLLVFGLVLYTMIRSIAYYIKNATSPVLSARAKVLSKRFEVDRHVHQHGNQLHHSTSTSYYATFELENGERMELVMNGRQYGLLLEGDQGLLTYQGDWFKDFEREK